MCNTSFNSSSETVNELEVVTTVDDLPESPEEVVAFEFIWSPGNSSYVQ